MQIRVKSGTVSGANRLYSTEPLKLPCFWKGEKGIWVKKAWYSEWDAELVGHRVIIPAPGKEALVRKFIAIGRLSHPDFPIMIKGGVRCRLG